MAWSQPEAVRIARQDRSDFELAPPIVGAAPPAVPGSRRCRDRSLDLEDPDIGRWHRLGAGAGADAAFSPPSLLISNSENTGSRRAPTVVAHGDYLLITWIDGTGGHVADSTWLTCRKGSFVPGLRYQLVPTSGSVPTGRRPHSGPPADRSQRT